MSMHPHQQRPHPSPPGPMSIQQLGPYGPPNGAAPTGAHGHTDMNRHRQVLTTLNEEVWLKIGNMDELSGDLASALKSYEQALKHNAYSVPVLSAISSTLRTQEKYPEAMEYLSIILKSHPTNGDVWGNMGHCHLMMDNLQEAYGAYQQALYYLPDPKEPKLWYGIGILYDRYGSLEHAEEAFSQVMRMQPDFEKANEIYFRLGIIYKQQQKFSQSLECFKYIVQDPPRPLNEEDIWFQIGHVHEQQKDYESAKIAYRRVLDRDAKHAKVLQQLGWLHHQQSNSYTSQDQAIEYLEQSVSSDNGDAQSWYLLGRCYMAQQKFPKAYEAYQQAVYRDGRNPTFWCSIGVLYYQINQYRDALDAYSRAIRLNPYISEVWYDLGTLYESCNNQTSDALDAYARAAELDPTNTHIKSRLQLLRSGGATGPNQHNAPVPQDVHPQAYQNGVGVPPGPQWGGQHAQAQPGPPPQGDPARINDWTRGIPGIQQPPPQQQQQQQQQSQQQQQQQQLPQSNPYEQRDGMRAPPPHPSPRQEPPRQYHDPARQTPIRKQSPSPKMNPAMPGMYPPGPQSLPQLNIQDRAPAFGAVRPPPPTSNGSQSNGINGAPPQNNLPPYGRPFSPPQELRPLQQQHEQRPPSPGLPYPRQTYNHQPPTPSGLSAIANGAPPPAAALAAAEAAAREREERPQSAMKRSREWEGEPAPSKKAATEETRARLDEPQPPSRRTSPPQRMPTPREEYRRSSSEIRRENERRATENYHPSEAAHHPYTLPAQQIPSVPAVAEPEPEQKTEPVEAAARKVDVDEDYDNNSEDEKRAAAASAAANTASAPAAATPAETPQTSPTNGSTTIVPKQEAVAA